MDKDLKAFKIKVNGKVLDYRAGQDLNLNNIQKFFSRKYQIEKIWSAPRHVLGILRKDGNKLFLKLSKSEGIGAMTQIEHEWNEVFNQKYLNLFKFRVPKSYDSGFYNNLFYEVMEYFEGEPLCNLNEKAEKVLKYILEVIELSEFIQKIETSKLRHNDYIEAKDYNDWFVKKTKLWFDGIPQDVVEAFKAKELLKIVEEKSSILKKRTRHGDFTPWHIIKLKDHGLGLTDGEHVISDGVENYDICYFIQRVHSELKGEKVAQNILNQLLKKGYDKNKLKIVLTARAVGGFLDESLKPKPNYEFKNKFKDWILEL